MTDRRDVHDPTATMEPPVLGKRSDAASKAEHSAPLRPEADSATAAIRADGGDAGWCALRAASVAGVRHRLAGQAAEDSFAWVLAGERLAVAVADGLGSVPGSAGASGRAAKAATSAAAGFPGSAAEAVTAGLEAANVAAGGGGATTLVLAVVEMSGEVQLARVGDSSAMLVEEGGSWSEVFLPEDDDRDDGVVETRTDAIPTADLASTPASTSLARGSVLALVTDGVGDPWRDGPSTVASALGQALVSQPSPQELARWAGFSRQGCHDDRTVVVVWMTGPGVTGPTAPAEG